MMVTFSAAWKENRSSRIHPRRRKMEREIVGSVESAAPGYWPLQGEILRPARNLIDQRGQDFIGMEVGQVSCWEV